MFVEEADVCVRLLKSLIILLVETACCGNKEEDVEEDEIVSMAEAELDDIPEDEVK